MTEKLRTALFCLLFAVPFGGVGVGASWLIWTMIHDGSHAVEWAGVTRQ